MNNLVARSFRLPKKAIEKLKEKSGAVGAKQHEYLDAAIETFDPVNNVEHRAALKKKAAGLHMEKILSMSDRLSNEEKAKLIEKIKDRTE